MYMCFDPGETTGWAIFNSAGDITAKGQTRLADMPEMLHNVEGNILVVIYENFKLFSGRAKQQSGSDMPASQAIGQIKMFAHSRGAAIVEQPPSIKPIAQKWSGLKPIGAHKDNHWVDAYNHGVYYLVSNGIKKSALELQQEREKANG